MFKECSVVYDLSPLFSLNRATAAGGLKLHGIMYLKYGCMIVLCVNHAAAAFDIQDTTKAVTARA